MPEETRQPSKKTLRPSPPAPLIRKPRKKSLRASLDVKPGRRVISYARESPSPARQDKAIRQHGVNAQHARRADLTVVGLLSEVCGRSAPLDDRPMLRAALAQMRTSVDGVLVRDLCRLGCEPALVPLLVAVRDAGGEVFSTRRIEDVLLRGDLDDPYVRGELRRIGIADEVERAEMRRRLELNRQHTMAMGGYGGGFDTRYGFTLAWVGDRRVFVPDPVEYQVLMRMIAERDAGRFWHQIADDLNRDGIATATGRGRWWPASVRACVSNERARAEYREGLDASAAEA